jgi:hypothetical protein
VAAPAEAQGFIDFFRMFNRRLGQRPDLRRLHGPLFFRFAATTRYVQRFLEN